MKLIFKIIVSVVLITILLWNVDFAKVFEHLKSYSVFTILLAFFLLTIQFPVSVIKWNQSLHVHNLSYPFFYLQKVLCIGFFFNNFLPTSIGGDAYRAIKTMPKEGYKSTAVSAIFIERLIGFAALVGLGFLGAIYVATQNSNEIASAYIYLCLLGGVGVIGFFLLSKLALFNHYYAKLKAIKKLDMLFHNIDLVISSPKLLVKIALLSVMFQVIAVFAIVVLFNTSFSFDLFAKCALLAAAVGLAGLLPISINGIGVMEGAFAMTAVQLGMDFDQAIVIAFIQRALVIPLSLICGVIYALDSDKKDELKS